MLTPAALSMLLYTASLLAYPPLPEFAAVLPVAAGDVAGICDTVSRGEPEKFSGLGGCAVWQAYPGDGICVLVVPEQDSQRVIRGLLDWCWKTRPGSA